MSRGNRLTCLSIVMLLLASLSISAPAAAASGPNDINLFAIHTDGSVISGLYVEMCSTTTATRTCYFGSTDAAGMGRITGYEPDTYTFRYVDSSDEYLDGFLTWAFQISDAEVFDYTEGGTFGRAIQPLRPSSLSGVVTGSDGLPLANVQVIAAEVGGLAYRTTRTADDGKYEIDQMIPGGYVVEYRTPVGADFASEWYPDATTEGGAAPVVVANETDRVLDVELRRHPTIAGTVVDEAGAPISGATVTGCRVVSGSSTDCRVGVADGDGIYDVVAPPGEYRVQFSSDGFHTEYWENESSSLDHTPALLTASNVTGIDAELEAHRTITGRVTDSAGQPLDGATAFVRSVEIMGSSRFRQDAVTGPDGVYTAEAMGAAEYTVEFRHPDGVPEFWDDASSREEATVLDLRVATAASEIDAALVTSGAITGTVVDAGGSRLVDVRVRACAATCATTTTDVDGSYRVGGLDAGDYSVQFRKSGYVTEYYDDVLFGPNGAERVPVLLQQTTTGIDAELGGSASIEGRLTTDGVPIDDGAVQVCTASGACTYASTASDGTYSVGTVPAEPLTVELFDPVRVELVPAVIEVNTIAGEVTSGVDADLVLGGSISGTVTDSTGRRLFASEARVEACSASLNRCRSMGLTISTTGDYRIDGLEAAADYLVEFVPTWDPVPRVPQWWCGVERVDAARSVAVVAGVETVGIDASLRDVGGEPGELPEPCEPGAEPSGTFTSVGPQRFADSRAEVTFDGRFRDTGRRPATSTWEIDMAGRGEVPASAHAVVVNVTVLNGTGPGFATVYPCGDLPLAASLNYDVGQVESNEVVARLSGEGTLCVYTLTAVDVIVDVVGAATESGYSPMRPTRYGDSRNEATFDGKFRNTGKRAGNTTWEVDIAGRGDVPSTAAAVVVNVTVAGAGAAGFATVHSCDDLPLAASLTYGPATVRPNELITKLSDSGTMCVYTLADTDIIIDVVGFIDGPTDGYSALVPRRYADSRSEATFDGAFRNTGKRTAGSTWEIDVAGRGPVPEGATSAVVNLSVTGATGPGFATAFPCGELPATASVNFGVGTTRSNELVVELSDSGTLCIFTRSAVDVIVDVVGSL